MRFRQIKRFRKCARQSDMQRALPHSKETLSSKVTPNTWEFPANLSIATISGRQVLQTIEAHGLHQFGSEGQTSWTRDFSGIPRELDFDEAESQRAFRSIRTHQWLSENSPYQLQHSPTEPKPGEASYLLVDKNDLKSTEIVS